MKSMLGGGLASASGRSPIISSTTARLCASFSLQGRGQGGAPRVAAAWRNSMATPLPTTRCSRACAQPRGALQSTRTARAARGSAGSTAGRGRAARRRVSKAAGRTGWPAQSPLGRVSPHPAPSRPPAAHRRQTAPRQDVKGPASPGVRPPAGTAMPGLPCQARLPTCWCQCCCRMLAIHFFQACRPGLHVSASAKPPLSPLRSVLRCCSCGMHAVLQRTPATSHPPKC